MDHIAILNQDELEITEILRRVNPDESEVNRVFYNKWDKRLKTVKAWKVDNKRFIKTLMGLSNRD